MRNTNLLFLLSLLLVACQPALEEIEFNAMSIVFDAVIERRETKTELDNDGCIKWRPGDAIKLFYGFNGQSSTKLIASIDDASFKAEFRGQAEDFAGYGSTFFAVYPYSQDASFSPTAIDVELPSEQIAKPNSFADDLFISVAKSNNRHLHFYNVCGGVCITVVQEGIKTVSLYGGGNMAGKARVSIDDNGKPTSVWTYENISSVTLSAPEGETLIPGTQYYFVCYPEELGMGYTLTFTKEDGTQAIKQDSKPVSIKRATFGVLRDIDKDLVFGDIITQKEAEREALIAIYNAGEGAKWPDWMANWCTDAPLSEWGGVTTNELGLVNSLSIHSYHGSIPEEIGVLESLESLHIYGEFTGQIPHSLASLKKLKHLEINRTGLGYDELGLSDIECDWSQLQSLEELTICEQSISGSIPESLGALKNLESLNLSANKISGSVPSSFGALQNLVSLDLSSNLLSGEIPEAMSGCQSLQRMILSRNQLSGELPAFLWSLPNLEVLALDENNFTGQIPQIICNSPKLSELGLSSNSLSGRLPNEIWCIPNLTLLDLSFNSFTGALSDDITNAKQLCYLNLCSNNLSGAIPEELYTLTSLGSLNLSSWYEHNGVLLDNKNSFSCELSSRIGNLINLEELYVSNCDLYGEIPESLTNLNKLCRCRIHDNNFSGDIPDSLKDMSNLSEFWCHGNRLSGFISKDLQSTIENRGWSITPQQDGYEFVYNLYESSDYSHNWEVRTLQRASEGRGIDIVLVGDAYTDSDIANGLYDRIMNLMYEALFEVEPFKSHRDYFNVHEIVLVSKNNSPYGETALGIRGDPLFIYTAPNNSEDFYSKVLDLIPGAERDNLTISIATPFASGTGQNGCCYFINPSDSSSKDLGFGLAITRYNENIDDYSFKGTIQHEVCGHGFGKLADEYFYDSSRQIESGDIEFINIYHQFGWYQNVDIFSDPEKILWGKFFRLQYYLNEGIGVYEGGNYYGKGVWRPSENSIMRSSSWGVFNAPSREAIYKRIHQIAYGQDWEYNFEDFVEWDKAHPSNQPAMNTTTARKSTNYVEHTDFTLAPDVFVVDNMKTL